MKMNGVLTYLHSDHLGSTVLETNASGQIVADQRYYAYGRQRDTGPVGTDYGFTGQKLDGTGLVYMNARYYDPVLGQFISPDTLVPDAGVLLDYNRYGYARGNPLKYNDPSGHCVFGGIDTLICLLLGAALILHGDSADTTYIPTQADVNSSQLGGALIFAGGGGAVASVIGPPAKAVVVGAAANASANATTQLVRDGKIDTTELGVAAGYGAVGGATTALPGYWGIVANGFLGSAQQVTTDVAIHGQIPSEAVNVNTVIAAGLGAAGAVAQGSMPAALKYPTSDGGEVNVLAQVVDYAPNFTRETSRQLQADQAAYAGGIRYISGFFISSLPVSDLSNAPFVDPVRGPR